jgi:hypothetical protein
MSKRRFVVLLLAAVACGRESAPSTSTVATWTVDSTPSLSIGRDASENLDAAFESITGATRLPDGRLLVADLGDAPLKMFAADGAFQQRIARKGAGPGEITYLATLFRCDTVVYSNDISGRRISQWSLEGRYLREFRFPMPEGQQTPYESACSPNGRFVHLGWGARGVPKAGYHRDTVPVWTTETAESAPSFVDSVPASERWGTTHDGRITGSRPLPFAKQPYVGVSADFIFVATGDDDGVRVYGLDGVARSRIAFAEPAPPVTPQDVRDLVERAVVLNGESSRQSIERDYAAITFPAVHSAVTALVIDVEGLVWLRRRESAGSEHAEWHVFEADGQRRATIALPARLEVFEIGVDYILGREIDTALGVPLLTQYRLQRTASRP